MYGPPLRRKRKMRVTGWSAQMYTAFIGAQKLLASMECAAPSSYLVRQRFPSVQEPVIEVCCGKCCPLTRVIVKRLKRKVRCMTSLKLLVVEDDAASLELMTEVFTSLKAEVRPVGDSEKAAGMVNQEKFDGIFLDLEMPKLSGFDLARVIRE